MTDNEETYMGAERMDDDEARIAMLVHSDVMIKVWREAQEHRNAVEIEESPGVGHEGAWMSITLDGARELAAVLTAMVDEHEAGIGKAVG